jgi:hypothetical protein
VVALLFVRFVKLLSLETVVATAVEIRRMTRSPVVWVNVIAAVVAAGVVALSVRA